MKSKIQFSRPRTLVDGNKYIAVTEKSPLTKIITCEEVIFASYTSSPATVIVTNAAGVKQKIDRSEIYETDKKK